LIETAQTQFDYTTIAAPSDGRIGVRLVDPGNLVRASDQGSIAILTRTQPIAVMFTLPARSLDDVRDAMARGPVEIAAFDRDNRRALSTGKLLLIDNQIDQTTATIRLKAIFANEDERLWPGEFVNARLLVETRPSALVVPSIAVQRGPQGLFAWVVSDKNIAVVPQDRGRTDDPAISRSSPRGSPTASAVVTDGQYKLQKDGPGDHHGRAPGGRWHVVNLSEPFIRRPIATSLLMAALAFVGIVSYPFLPVAPLPQIDFPTIQVQVTFAGASAETMATSVAAPLERQFGQIAGVTADDVAVDGRRDDDRHPVRSQPEHRFRRAGRAGRDHRRRQDAAAIA